MQVFRSICNVAATGILMLVFAAPPASFAHDQVCHPGEHRQINLEERGLWAKNQMDKEAAWLEINASQQTAWEAYAAANLELLRALGDRKPLPPNIDAASAIRQHAEHAATFAQSLSKLADATDKLQAVLNENQRKVLDRIVRLHSQFQAGHFGEGRQGHEDGHRHHGSEASPNASKSSPKTPVPAKPKN